MEQVIEMLKYIETSLIIADVLLVLILVTGGKR